MGLALQQLQSEMNFEELLFWGKIEGKSIEQASKRAKVKFGNV